MPTIRTSRAAIVRLFFSCSPVAVIRCVRTVVVAPLNRVICCRTRPHVVHESIKITDPFRTYCNSPRTVSLEVATSLRQTTLLHSSPDDIDVMQRMVSSRGPKSFVYSGTTGSRQTTLEAMAKNDDGSTAIAAAFPNQISTGADAAGERHYQQGTETPSDNILKRLFSWKGGLVHCSFRLLVLSLVYLAVSVSTATVDAQTVPADRVRLNAGPCVFDGVDGTPDQLRLVGNCSGITTSAATNLTLMPTGDLYTNPAGKDILPVTNYDINIGLPVLKYLSLSVGELLAETLVAQDVIATIGGRVVVAPTTLLTSDLTNVATSIIVKHNNLASGDRIYLQAAPGGVSQVEFMAVTSGASGSGPYTYSVTRNLDGSGANTWYAGDAVLNTGQSGTGGFIDLYSTAGILGTGSGPTIVGNVRTGTTYNAYAARWAIGNLNGLYGYGVTTYGSAFGDPSATNVTVDATNGFRIRNSTTNKFVADTSGNLSIVGDLSVGTAGVIRSNATAFGTGTGYWLAYNGGTPQFRVGNPSGAQISWDGTSLVVRGDGSSITNMIRNADCAVGTEDWGTVTNTGQTPILGTAWASWNLNSAGGTCYIRYTTTPANGTVTQGYTTPAQFPVIQGHRYEASAYTAQFNTGDSVLIVQWLDNAAAQISLSTSNICNTNGSQAIYLSEYCRVGVIADAPTGAVNARVYIQTTHNGSATPFIFWVHALFGENPLGVLGTPTSVQLSAWGPAGQTEITGGIIKTGSIVADNIAAGAITATKINVSSLSAISANIGTITAGSISGVTASFGGTVTLDSSGITISDGTSGVNKVKWSGGSGLYAVSGALSMEASSNISFAGMGTTYVMDASGLYNQNDLALGLSGERWGTLYLSSGIDNSAWTGGGNRTVCVNNSGVLYANSGAC